MAVNLRGKQFSSSRALPRLRTPTAVPRGPLLYRRSRDRGFISDFIEPPVDFVMGQNSRYEWPIYKAISEILGFPQHPEVGPFYGEPGMWDYQVGTSALGGSKIDFVVYPHRRTFGERVAMRTQTEYFHNFVDEEIYSYDILQLWTLSEYNRVVDLYDYEYMYDPTGQAACILVKEALAGSTWSPTVNTGVAQRVRPSRTRS